MANTKVTKAVLADDAVGLAQLDITNDPSDGQALTAVAVTDGYNLTWANNTVAGISSSADANAIFITSAEKIGLGATHDLGANVHIKTADSGVSAVNGNADDLVIENADYTGISILGENETSIFFGDNEDSDVGRIEYFHSADRMSFRTGGTDRIKVDSDGLKFGSDTAATNALDDYEEGQWTPTIQGSTGAGTYTYGTNHGEYMKVGNIVVANFRIDQIGVSSAGSGNIEIHGFPFTAKATTLQYYWGSVILEYFDTAPSTVALSVGVKDPGTHALIWESRDTTTNGVVSITDINNTSNADIWGQVTYMT